MNEVKVPSDNQPIPLKSKNHSCLIIVIVFIIIFLAGGIWVVVRWRSAATHIGEFQALVDENLNQGNKSSGLGADYQTLVATWETDCLVPDPNSPWAEKHQFIFDSDGSAHHTRWSGDSCAGLSTVLKDNYTVTIPTSGKINFVGSEGTMYDIYSITGDTLMFGHGFCNCTKLGSFGTSDSNRFTLLNTFLVYKKIP